MRLYRGLAGGAQSSQNLSGGGYIVLHGPQHAAFTCSGSSSLLLVAAELFLTL